MRLESQEMPSSTTKAMQKKKKTKTNKKRRMSTDRDDDDSLAEQQSIIIVCDTCSNHIGRMHRGDNDDDASSIVKDTFSFRLDAVDRYFFGSGDLRVIPPPPPDNASAGDHDQDSIEEEDEDTKNNTEVDRMKQDLDDVKKTVAKMQEELSLHRKKLAQYDALFSESAD